MIEDVPMHIIHLDQDDPKKCTAEALATCLVLLNRYDQAERVLASFNWGEQFMILNKEPLEAYRNALTREELIELQWEFFDNPND